MAKKDIGNIPKVAQGLVGHLPKAINDELKSLIAQAEEGQNVVTKMIDLFSQYEATSLWLKEQLDHQSREKGIASYGPLAGKSSLVSLSQKWICPEDPNEPWILVIQDGEDPPVCEKHKIDMVRESEGKEE